MKLKLDENLGVRGVRQLAAAGHDVQTVFDEGLAGEPDARLIEQCRREDRVFVTLDLEFGNPLVYDPGSYPGIAVLRLPARPTPDDLDTAIDTLVAAIEARPVSGKLWIVERARIREYQPDREAGDPS